MGIWNVTYEVEVPGEQAMAVRHVTQNMSQNHTDFEGTLGKQLALAGADVSAVSTFSLCCFEEAVEVVAPATSTTAHVTQQVLPSGSHAWDIVAYVGGGAVAVLVMALCVFCCGKKAAKTDTKDAMLEVSWALEAALSDHLPVTRTPSCSSSPSVITV